MANVPVEVSVGDHLIAPDLEAWAAQSIERMSRRCCTGVEAPGSERRRRLVIVHLDGVPRRMFDEVVESGTMPFLSALIRSGTHRLDSAFWGSPASTPFFQAGALYGLRHPNLPAYVWFDRELGREVRMNIPRDVLAIEQRLDAQARGNGLLRGGGTAYLSIFRAEAANLTCMSALADLGAIWRSAPSQLRGLRWARRRGLGKFLRLLFQDVVNTVRDVRRWVRKVRDWRHEWEYFFNRFLLLEVAWNLAHTRTLIDMVRGVPAIYLVYGNYDEVSHRRGPFSPQARFELDRVDRDLAEIYALSRLLPRPYDLYLVTDHGHVESVPFEQRLGTRLKPFLMEGPPMQPSEAMIRGLLDGRAPLPAEAWAGRVEDEPVVIEAGNFAHVYLTRGMEPLGARELVGRFPGVLARAAYCRDIAITAVRRGGSAVALIKGEVYGPREVHRAPLASEFSRRAVADLLTELPHMKTAGDLVLYGESVKENGTVGFAWEFGSHGGLTRMETEAVVVWPSDAPVDLGGLSHASQLHQRLSEAYLE